jgi:transposase
VQKWSQRSSPKNRRTREFLASKQITVLEHPHYSPDLAPSDFFLFPKVKEVLKRRHFDDIDDIRSNTSSEGHSTKPVPKLF